MTITVSPTSKCNFHVSLKDVDGYEMGLIVEAARPNGEPIRSIRMMSRSPVDRTAMKTSSGDTEYSDWRPPYYALKQDDWSGGRGNDDHTKDKSKFLDAGGLNTRRAGYLHLNGQEQLSDLLRAGGQIQPGSIQKAALPAVASTEWATKIVPDTNTNYDQIWFYSHLDTAISGVKLYNGNAAAFATPIVTDPVTLVSTPPSFAPGWHVITLDTAIALNSTDGVWISVPLSAGVTKIAVDQATSGFLKQGGSPVASYGFPCRALVSLKPSWGKLFKYWDQIYYCYNVGAVTHLWKNGYAGVLSTGGTSTVTDSSYSGVWTTNELAGKIFLVQGGTGFSQNKRWQKILSNTTAGVIVFEEAFEVALSTDTFFAILGTDHWEEVPGGTPGSPTTNAHGLSGNVTDILVGDLGLVYFAQGDGYPLIKMYQALATGGLIFATDAAAPGPRHLAQVGTAIWGVEHSTFQAKFTPQGASFTDAWDNVRVWDDAITCGDVLNDFTNVLSYADGSGTKAPMIFKEGEFGFITDGIYSRVQLDEYKSLTSERNGRCAFTHDTNAYFSFGNGLQRWYYPNLDDVGPNREEGLPANRQGEVRCGTGYPGRFFVGVDAGDAGYSGVFSTDSYHEEWRGAYGQRVLDVLPQYIHGTNLDRLWIAAGGDLLWVPMPSETTNPLNDTNMLYAPGGYVETSTYMTDMKTVLKYISLIKFFFKDTYTAGQLEVQYKIDGGSWTDLDSTTNPVTTDLTVVKYPLTNVVSEVGYYGIKAYSFQLRIKLFTTDRTTTPVIRALVMELLARIENKWAYTIPFMIEGTALDPAYDLLGTKDDIPLASTKLDKLVSWASAGPLYMRSQDVRFHDKMVLLLPFTESLVEFVDTDGRIKYLGQLTLQDG